MIKKELLVVALLLLSPDNVKPVEVITLLPDEQVVMDYLIILAELPGEGPSAQQYLFCLHCPYKAKRHCTMTLHTKRHHQNADLFALSEKGALLRRALTSPVIQPSKRRSQRLLAEQHIDITS